MDAFGLTLPSFNIRGNDRHNSIAGGVFSIVLYMTLMVYGIIKLYHLASKHNPNISAYFKFDEL